MMKTTTYQQELYRKAIHLSSLWIPVAIWNLERSQALILLTIGFLLVLLFEVLRRNDKCAPLLNEVFRDILRRSEIGKNGKLTGAFYMLVAALIVTISTTRDVAAAAMSVLIISDTLAALVGKKWGEILIGHKSLEGSVAFFMSAVVIVIFFAYLAQEISLVSIIIGIIVCLVTAIVELYASKFKMDDNLLIPLVFALLQTGGLHYFAF